jgi:hypothetical protein
MKKIDLALTAMTLLLMLLSSTMLIEGRVIAQGGGGGIEIDNLTCNSLNGNSCCGSANCGGPGAASGCTLNCTGGGTITCSKIVQGVCQ